MSLRSVSYFKAETVADLAACDSDCVVFVEEDGRQYVFDGISWHAPDTATGGEAFPVGSIFISVGNTNPNSSLGYGTWAVFGTGRTLVGFDAAQAEFDTGGKTGGAKTHILTIPEMPVHTHTQDAHSHGQSIRNTGTAGTAGAQGGSTANNATAGTTAAVTATNQNTGGGAAHNNLQPYIVVYFWQRVS